MRKLRFVAALLLAPLAAGVVAGPLFSAYLSLGERPFFDEGFFRAMLTFGFMVTVLAYIATFLCFPIVISYAQTKGRYPSLWFTVGIGALVGAITPECIPWVWFLHGDIGSPTFFIYVGLGALSGAVVAALFWFLALRSEGRILAA